MGIEAKEVMRLRAHTGAGMMDCKSALASSGGDWEGAIEWLRKKGQKISAARAERATKEGLVVTRVAENAQAGIVFAVRCETDFVARNSEFREWVNQVADGVLAEAPDTLEALLQLHHQGVCISDALNDWTAKVGERMTLTDYRRVCGDCVVAYQHAGDQLGVLVVLTSTGSLEVAQRAGKNVAMQIAAMNPMALNSEDIPQDVIEKELEIGRAIAKKEGKPEAIQDKIAQGRLHKFFKEHTLLRQAYVKEPRQSIADYLKSEDASIAIQHFARIALG